MRACRQQSSGICTRVRNRPCWQERGDPVLLRRLTLPPLAGPLPPDRATLAPPHCATGPHRSCSSMCCPVSRPRSPGCETARRRPPVNQNQPGLRSSRGRRLRLRRSATPEPAIKEQHAPAIKGSTNPEPAIKEERCACDCDLGAACEQDWFGWQVDWVSPKTRGNSPALCNQSVLQPKPVWKGSITIDAEAPQNPPQNRPPIRHKYHTARLEISGAHAGQDRPTRRKHREIQTVCAQIKNTEDTGGPGGT